MFFFNHTAEKMKEAAKETDRERENGNKNTSFVNRVSIKNEMAKCNLFNV